MILALVLAVAGLGMAIVLPGLWCLLALLPAVCAGLLLAIRPVR